MVVRDHHGNRPAQNQAQSMHAAQRDGRLASPRLA
jgi:hypothetical protein